MRGCLSLMADAGWVHKTCGDPEYAGHVLLVGVDHVRLPHTRHLKLGVSHVQYLDYSNSYLSHCITYR